MEKTFHTLTREHMYGIHTLVEATMHGYVVDRTLPDISRFEQLRFSTNLEGAISLHAQEKLLFVDERFLTHDGYIAAKISLSSTGSKVYDALIDEFIRQVGEITFTAHGIEPLEVLSLFVSVALDGAVYPSLANWFENDVAIDSNVHIAQRFYASQEEAMEFLTSKYMVERFSKVMSTTRKGFTHATSRTNWRGRKMQQALIQTYAKEMGLSNPYDQGVAAAQANPQSRPPRTRMANYAEIPWGRRLRVLAAHIPILGVAYDLARVARGLGHIYADESRYDINTQAWTLKKRSDIAHRKAKRSFARWHLSTTALSGAAYMLYELADLIDKTI